MRLKIERETGLGLGNDCMVVYMTNSNSDTFSFSIKDGEERQEGGK